MNDLKPHEDYKDSGQPWLGKVPTHWTLRRAKLLYREVDERSTTGTETLCSVSHKTGVTPRKANVTMFMAESTVGYKICRPGDLAINTLWAYMAALGVAREVGIVSPAYGVYRPRADSSLLPEYADRLLRIEEYKHEYIARSTGVNASRLRLYPEQFLKIAILLPPPEEQATIVRFLAALDRRVNRFVRAKRRLIELLNEQKQAIITAAITRGLNPNAKLKPSRTAWRNVPTHWKELPIKRAFSSMEYGISDPSTDDASIPVLTMGNIKNGRVSIPTSGGVNSVDPLLLLTPGDLLFNRTNSAELVGKVGHFLGHSLPVTFASYLVRLRPCAEYSPTYLNFVLNESAILAQARREAIPSLHQCNLNPTRYGRFSIALPERQEQESILGYITEKSRTVEEAAERAEREIDLIREYRARLVSDVVTGKLDVRAAATRLPVDETGPVEPVAPAGEEVEEEVASVEEEAAYVGADESE